MDIIVYKTPQVSFEASVSKGCIPVPVTFTSNSSAGDGSISSYFWDFGDGTTQSGNQQIQHTYSTPQTVTAGLTVTNSHGCYSTVNKNAVIKVLPPVVAAFNTNETVLCKVSDAASFTNMSTGPATLSYTWDFGDGKTAMDKTPSHIYDNKGIYTVKLMVQSSEGCSGDATKNAYINVANFSTDFAVPPLLCENNSVTFTDKSNPLTSTQIWMVDGAPYYYNGSQFYYSPAHAGSSKIQLINTYGSCADTATKNIIIKPEPKIKGFMADMQGVCGSPVSVKFKDTSLTAVKWEWDFTNNYYSFNPTAFTQASSFTYTYDNSYQVRLRITNADGCSSNAFKTINIYKANADISSSNGYTGCETLTTTLSATSAIDISEYHWDFGDGTTSVEKTPKHTFGKPGYYTVTLSYTNINGCKETTDNYVTVYAKPVFDFTAAPGTTICGNNPVTFTASGTNIGANYYYWNFGDNSYNSYEFNSTVTHQYFADTSYTVSLVISNGTCIDTVTKTGYVKVLPPFPKISDIINTCEGARNTVTFKETSQKATQWSWDFGDGSAAFSYMAFQPTVTHMYSKTGAYKIVLTATNGTCSVRDSGNAYVLLKQKPLLASAQTEVCGNTVLNTTISQMETNPAYNYYYNSDFGIRKIEYGDGSVFNGYTSSPDYSFHNTYHLDLNNAEPGKKDIRVITTSYFFNCADTTNFIPVKIKGPVAGFTITGNNVCFKSPATIKDTSKGINNVAIEKWEWNYGDGRVEILTSGGTVYHKYDNPGSYYVSLKVTDKDGCISSAQNYNSYISVKGPKANFGITPNPVSPSTTVYFNNYSNTYNTNYYDNHYTWIFGDGAISKDVNYTSHSYAESGIDTVMLVAANNAEHCADTAVQYLHVKNINLGYTYNITFINPGSGCPPVLASFTNTSVNATRVTWDFGDGGTADNLDRPSHTYQKPGVYKVTLYGYFDNGTMDSTFDYITIKGPYAALKADRRYSCGAQAITLIAEAKNTSAFTWDFGDGTLLDIPDTFAVHQYLTPGVYMPALIVRDGSGCSFPFYLDDKIVIDTLHFTIAKRPAVICNPALVNFTPEIVSTAKNELQQPLQYFWNFGTGNPGDTAVSETPSFFYNTAGSYPVTLKIASPYGCVEQITDSLMVKARKKGMIAGPSEICEDTYATFTATAGGSNLGWQWQFANNSSSTQQNPPAQLFTEAGTASVMLVVNNDGCYDTTYSLLTVHGKPDVNLTPKEPHVCLNDSVQLQAHDGTGFTWSPSAYISNTKVSNPAVFPKTDTRYVVEAVNTYGCTNRDSVTVAVTQPFNVTADPEVYLCRGSSTQLNAQGADKYLWIEGTGLSNTQISNPLVIANAEENYTVVGYDRYGCFTDTAFTRLRIAELPSVNAGADVTIPAGTNTSLKGVASNDVIKWKWQPPEYLSCTTCAAPVSTPHSDVTYVAEVTNAFGCTKKDSVTVHIMCKRSLVYIPTGFTPNGDGTNERFSITGNGIQLIKHLVIFDRWGETVFEKTNAKSNDPGSSWDGSYKGNPAPPGTYAFMAEIICDAGEIYTYKGSVTLIR